MSEVKFGQTVADLDRENPSFPKANTHLLQEFRTRIQNLEEAEREAEYQRHLSTLPPDQRAKAIAEREELKKAGKEASLPAAKPEEIPKEKLKTQRSWTGAAVDWAHYLVMGEDPEKIIKKTGEAVETVKSAVGSVLPETTLPFTFSKVDPDQNRELRDAETRLHVEKYRMRKLINQVESDLDPFSVNGRQIGTFGPYEKNVRYDTRSTQEALSIMATMLAVSTDIAQRKNDPELTMHSNDLAAFLAMSSKLTKEEFESFGYSSEIQSDEQLAQKWGLMRGNNATVPGMGALAQNKLPEMFFEVQQLITSYRVMQTLTSIETELEGLLKEVELDSSLSIAQKATKRREIWKSTMTARITGSLSQGDEVDGVKTKVNEHLYGAAILAPLLMQKEGGLNLGEATVFRLVAEKSKREAKDEFAQEQAYRIVDGYSFAESSGKIRDLVESKFGKKASDLTDAELDQALTKLRKELGNDYTSADNLYGRISKNLPPFIELRRALDSFAKGAEPPPQIDTALSSRDDFEILMKEIRTAREAAQRTINERLKLDPAAAIKMADQFAEKNKGNLSQEASQIPQSIRAIAERTFGYHQ